MDISRSVIESVKLPIGKRKTFLIDVKREDLIDEVISGNKWRKLKYNVLKAQSLHKSGLLTFGGAFSNHLLATAKIAQINGLSSIGLVRGEELSENSNETLQSCSNFGMKLVFVARETYSKRNDANYIKELSYQYTNYFLVPEGGKNYYGVIGCQEILENNSKQYDAIYLAGGTGTTAAGILLNSPPTATVRVVSALKGSFLREEIDNLLQTVLQKEDVVEEYMQRLQVLDDGHFGGFGKVNTKLINFINNFYQKTALRLDPIYTAKAMYQLLKEEGKGELEDKKVLFIHTGGLQGAASWRDELDYLKI